MLQPAWYTLPLAICRDDGDATEHEANEHTSDVHSAVHSPKQYNSLMNCDSGAQFEVPSLHYTDLEMCTLLVRHYIILCDLIYTLLWLVCLEFMALCNLVGEACAGLFIVYGTL